MKVKTVKVTDKGQIAIPIEIRKENGIENGDDLIIIGDNGKIMMEKVNDSIKDDFKDLLKNSESIARELWDHKEDEV